MEKTFCQNSDKFGSSFIKNDILCIYILCIYKKNSYIKLHHVYFENFDMPFKNIRHWIT